MYNNKTKIKKKKTTQQRKKQQKKLFLDTGGVVLYTQNTTPHRKKHKHLHGAVNASDRREPILCTTCTGRLLDRSLQAS